MSSGRIRPDEDEDNQTIAEDSVQALDVEIQDIVSHVQASLNRLSSLRRLRNEHVLVSRLPPEIMVAIFRAIDDTPRILRVGEQKTLGRPWLGWIFVSHVCHKWRHVAVNCPSLWSNISFALGSDWTGEMLRRSRATPIDIDYVLSPRNPRLLRSSVLENHLFHIRYLALEVSQMDRCISYLKEVCQVLYTRSPRLETLRLRVIPIISSEHPTPLNILPPITLPSTWSVQQFPCLRHLELVKFVIPWAALQLPFQLLSTLKLAFTTHLANFQPTPNLTPHLLDITSLVAVLGKLPNLAVLHLHHVLQTLPYDAFMDDISPRAVSLPHLVGLSLAGRAHECARIRRCLDISVTMHSMHTFDVTSLHETGDDLFTLIPSLDAFLSIPGSNKSFAFFDFGETLRLSVQFVSPSGSWKPRLMLLCRFIARRAPQEDSIAERISHMRSLEDITELVTLTDQIQTPQRWIAIFGHLRSVNRVHLVFRRTRQGSFTTSLLRIFFAALRDPFERPAGSSQTHFLFPCLSILVLMDLDLEHEHDSAGTLDLQHEIVTSLRARQNTPHPI